MRLIRLAWCLAAALLFQACGTIFTLTAVNDVNDRGRDYSYNLRRMDLPTPIYSGVYFDVHHMILFPFTASGEGALASIPFYPIFLVGGIIDTPLSLIADTAMLPYTIKLDKKAKQERITKQSQEELERRRLLSGPGQGNDNVTRKGVKDSRGERGKPPINQGISIFEPTRQGVPKAK